MKKPMKDRVGDFMAGKGFYIVLFLCVAAIGISGYYLFSSMDNPTDPGATVAGTVQVTVPPSAGPATATPAPAIVPEKPTVTSRPTPTATPAPTITQATPAPASPTPVTTSSVYTWPVKGEVLSPFSMEALAYDETMGDWRTHAGVDIAAQLGTQVLAAAGGTVTAIGQDDLMGTSLTLDHGNGMITIYYNLASVPAVNVGDVVSTGDVIGSVGATAIGESALPSHLHLEMMKDGLSTDPLSYLPD